MDLFSAHNQDIWFTGNAISRSTYHRAAAYVGDYNLAIDSQMDLMVI